MDYKSSAVVDMGDCPRTNRTKWAIKWGGLLCPFQYWGAGSPSNTMWTTSVPSGILIHPTINGHNTQMLQTGQTDNGPMAKGERFTNGRPKLMKPK